MNSEQIRKIRKRLGLSQREFAKLIGAGLRTVAGWEIGESTPLPLFQKQIRELAKKQGAAA